MSAIFEAQSNHSYAFRSIARDRAGFWHATVKLLARFPDLAPLKGQETEKAQRRLSGVENFAQSPQGGFPVFASEGVQKIPDGSSRVRTAHRFHVGIAVPNHERPAHRRGWPKARIKERWWNPNEPRLFTPRAFGWGYAVNLARVFRRKP
mgnify:CR=1 FL=1